MKPAYTHLGLLVGDFSVFEDGAVSIYILFIIFLLFCVLIIVIHWIKLSHSFNHRFVD